jgi:geranylgeranyl pyrophosphate synthase
MIQNYNDFYINLYSRVENDISEAMKAIASEFPKDNKLTTSVKYVLESHGKLVRPLFLYLCYLTLSKEVNKELKYIAAAIELIHTASLVHDDIIDNGLVRRGKETIFKHYGMPTAVLTGDLLIFLSMKIIAKCTLDSNKTLQVIQLLNETLCSMCIGQASEDKLIGNLQNDKKEYLQIIGLKTAQFFSTVCRISGFLAEGNDFEVSALTNFGYNVGMAYQIRDDVLSLIGDNEECNKTLESDLDRRLVTLPK